mmetsp:Transcript_5368/g.17642  ORF Transcript_5368/g.17642 Transcript_5368/m.17642 type:complete len:504 (-) Transcript_5368:642-2153(-)
MGVDVFVEGPGGLPNFVEGVVVELRFAVDVVLETLLDDVFRRLGAGEEEEEEDDGRGLVGGRRRLGRRKGDDEVAGRRRQDTRGVEELRGEDVAGVGLDALQGFGVGGVSPSLQGRLCREVVEVEGRRREVLLVLGCLFENDEVREENVEGAGVDCETPEAEAQGHPRSDEGVTSRLRVHKGEARREADCGGDLEFARDVEVVRRPPEPRREARRREVQDRDEVLAAASVRFDEALRYKRHEGRAGRVALPPLISSFVVVFPPEGVPPEDDGPRREGPGSLRDDPVADSLGEGELREPGHGRREGLDVRRPEGDVRHGVDHEAPFERQIRRRPLRFVAAAARARGEEVSLFSEALEIERRQQGDLLPRASELPASGPLVGRVPLPRRQRAAHHVGPQGMQVVLSEEDAPAEAAPRACEGHGVVGARPQVDAGVDRLGPPQRADVVVEARALDDRPVRPVTVPPLHDGGTLPAGGGGGGILAAFFAQQRCCCPPPTTTKSTTRP